MSTFTFNNERYALDSVICEGRQVLVICHVEAVLEYFSQLGNLDLLHTTHSDSNTFFYRVEIYCI